jgi:hypothetical protein
MSGPMKAVRDVLELQGDLEWARCVGGVDPLRPPFIAWRYATPDEKSETRLTEAMKRYAGPVEWTIRKGERNWVIEPASFQEYAKRFRVDAEALQRFGEEFPSDTNAALDDAPNLAAHLRRELERT